MLLGCRRSKDAIRYEVIDNGPGMRAEELERLRRPYEKGDSSTGEGLGLAICWQLANENGFELQVDSTAGKGSRFSLRVATRSVDCDD